MKIIIKIEHFNFNFRDLARILKVKTHHKQTDALALVTIATKIRRVLYICTPIFIVHTYVHPSVSTSVCP